MMIDVTSIDARPGEAEIVRLMAGYMAARLFTTRQRKALSVIIDLTSQPVRVPVTRAMLGPQKSGLGTRPPKQFEMTVSTAAGIRDAAEVVAHELLHISQAVNGRLLITAAKRKINGVKRVVDTARWMGGKPVTIDELAWQNRPWEIEACHWQSVLVTEFLLLTTGQHVDQPLQTPKRKQLALYRVKVPAPVMAPRSQAPDFTPAPVQNASSTDAAQAGARQGSSVIGNNGASIDAVIETAMPDSPAPVASSVGREMSPEAVMSALPEAHDIADDEIAADLPAMPQIEEPDDAMMADLAAELAVGEQFGGSFGGPTQDAGPAMPVEAQETGLPQNGIGTGVGNGIGNGIGTGIDTGIGNGGDLAIDLASSDMPDAAVPDHDGAVRNMPVYDKVADIDAGGAASTIEVDVPGLDAPRTLDSVAMSRKLDELRDRGLLSA